MWLAALLACTHAPGVASFSGSDGAALRYRLLVPEDPPNGILLFFPWDGGARDFDEAAARRAPIAAAHGLAIASVRQPEGACWWAPRVEDNARAVDALLREALLPTLGLGEDRVFTTGISGGADFASAFHLHTDFRYGGGVVALCGGDLPRTNGGDCRREEDPPPAAVGDWPDVTVRYDFAITADDPLRPASEAAAALYESLGATVRHRVVAGEGHCGFAEGFDGLGLLAEGLDQVDP